MMKVVGVDSDVVNLVVWFSVSFVNVFVNYVVRLFGLNIGMCVLWYLMLLLMSCL